MDGMKVSDVRLLLVVGVLLWAFPAAASNSVIRCQDAQGQWIFTDDERRCPEPHTDHAGPQAYEVKVQNLHSQFGQHVSEEYYNYAFRNYAPVEGRTLNIVAEQALINSHPELLEPAIAKLEKAVAAALATLPRQLHSEFSDVRYFFFIGKESMTGGRKGGQWYFRKGNRASERFDNSIVIRSTINYVKHYTDEQATRIAMHELSHAYYFYHSRAIYPDLKVAFVNAEAQKLYRKVKMEGGYELETAYAITNPFEYFAELAKTYHVGNYHYPFNRDDLREYDPVGFKMIERAFRYRY